MSNSRLDYLYYHIFLPSRLPQRSDVGQDEQALLDALLEAIAGFREASEPAYYQLWWVPLISFIRH